MGLKKLLGNQAHWNLNKELVRQVGLTETLVLQQIIDLTESAFKKKEIFHTIGQMSDELGISEYACKQAIGKLKSMGLINVERKYVGYKNWYSVNDEVVKQTIEGNNSPVDTKSTHWSVEGEINPLVDTNSTMSDDEINPPVNMKSTMSEVKINSLSVENLLTNTNNTTNNTVTKNIDKKYITNSLAGINYETLLDNMRDLNNENCADTISFVDTEIGWDTFMNNINYDSSAKQNFMNRIQNNAYNYGIELNFNK
jgi:DNA-binding transcriptional regulator GbsR (MarR family)